MVLYVDYFHEQHCPLVVGIEPGLDVHQWIGTWVDRYQIYTLRIHLLFSEQSKNGYRT